MVEGIDLWCSVCKIKSKCLDSLRRHIAQKGTKVKCHYCDKKVYMSSNSKKRHLKSGVCRRSRETEGFMGNPSIEYAFNRT